MFKELNSIKKIRTEKAGNNIIIKNPNNYSAQIVVSDVKSTEIDIS